MPKLIPQTPTERHLMSTYGVDCVLRYRQVISRPERVTGSKKRRRKPWFSESPKLTDGMRQTIKRQYSEGRSVASIAGRWAIPHDVVREVLSS